MSILRKCCMFLLALLWHVYLIKNQEQDLAIVRQKLLLHEHEISHELTIPLQISRRDKLPPNFFLKCPWNTTEGRHICIPAENVHTTPITTRIPTACHVISCENCITDFTVYLLAGSDLIEFNNLTELATLENYALKGNIISISC